MTAINIVTVGIGGVGKSALVNRFMCGEFVEDYDPTIEDNHRKQVTVDGSPNVLELLDTAGQEEMTSMQQHWFSWGEAFFLIYAINQRTSFVELKGLRDRIIHQKQAQANSSKRRVAMVVCGNKSDLVDEREVTDEGGMAFGQDVGSPFLETSAKDNRNVSAAFETLVREVRLVRDANGALGLGGLTQNKQPKNGLAPLMKKKRCSIL